MCVYLTIHIRYPCASAHVQRSSESLLVFVSLKLDFSSFFCITDIIAAAVLSGNRNFEGRVHPLTRANYLASPPLVVAYALAGTVCNLIGSVWLNFWLIGRG